jgi:multiple sugar transport system permease protein
LPSIFEDTLVVVGLNIVGALFSSSLAAFGFARIQFTGTEFPVWPGACHHDDPHHRAAHSAVLRLAPDWAYNTLYPLIVPAFFVNGFFIFLLRQFFTTIPPGI